MVDILPFVCFDRTMATAGQNETAGDNQDTVIVRPTFIEEPPTNVNMDLVSSVIADLQKGEWRPPLFRRAEMSRSDADMDLVRRYPGLFHGRCYADGFTLYWAKYGPYKEKYARERCHVRPKFEPERFSTRALKRQFPDYFQGPGCLAGLEKLYEENYCWQSADDERSLFRYRPE